MNIGSFSFNGFDVAVLVILLISLIIAVQRGFLREVLSLIALLLAGLLALFFWGQFRYQVQSFISPSWLADVTLGAGTFALVYLIAVFILSKIFGRLKAAPMKVLNRILGAGFGILRGLILASLGVMVLTASYHANLEAKDYKQSLEARGIYEQAIQGMPASMREQMESEPKSLPAYLEGSSFYPLLNGIGNIIRNLPFAKWKSYAERIKDGDIDDLNRKMTE